MVRENQRICRTKGLLKKSILELAEEKDLEYVTVTELCDRAGIHRATFYRHYQIPRDVMVELQKDLYHALRRTVPLPRSAEELQSCIEKLCAFVAENMSLMRTVIRNNSDSDFILFINELYSEIGDELRGLPELSLLQDEDLRLMSLYSAGGCYFVLRHWLLGNVNKSAEELAECILGLLRRTDLIRTIQQGTSRTHQPEELRML